MNCRTQDVRRALLFHTFLMSHPLRSPLEELRNAVNHLQDVYRIGSVQRPDGKGWTECRDNQRMGKVLLAGLQVAACQLHLDGCISLQLGRGARKLEGIANLDDGLLIWWDPSKSQEVMHCPHAPSNRVNLEALFGENWRRMAVVQFLCGC